MIQNPWVRESNGKILHLKSKLSEEVAMCHCDWEFRTVCLSVAKGAALDSCPGALSLSSAVLVSSPKWSHVVAATV